MGVRVQLPDESNPVRTPGAQGVRTQSEPSAINALQAHIATLKEQLAAAEARIEKLTTDLAARDASQANERAKADKTLADLLAQLGAEKANTAKALAALAALADPA